MRKLLKIKVTAKDIENGKRNDGARCPIARAARRVLKKVASVDGTVIEFKYDGNDYTDSILPKAASNFIARFDDKKKVKPFTFKVSAPVDFIR